MTDATLLDLALHGGETEWHKLQELCADHTTAERLYRLLKLQGNAAEDITEAWIGVLQEMHRDLVNSDATIPHDASKRTAGGSRRLRILCADDHELICELLDRALSEAGHEVRCVLDGQAAWNLISAEPSEFDVLVTDHDMPGLTGLELVQKIRGTSFAGKIVVASGKMTPELEAAYHAFRVDGIVSKTAGPKAIPALFMTFVQTASPHPPLKSATK